MESLRLHWLGHLLVEWKGMPIKLETRKAAALLAYISLNAGESSREVLATMFWHEGSQQKALANLRHTLASLNSSLPGWIEADRETIALKRNGKLWVDVDVFCQSLSHLQEHHHPENNVCDECLSTLDKAQRLPEALRLMDSSLALAEPEGYMRIFLDIGEPACELLVAYLQLAAADHEPYAKKVLEAFSSSR